MALIAAKLRDTESAELEREARELRDQIWKLDVQSSTGQVQDPHKTRAARRDLARVLTILRERELAEGQSKGRNR